MQTANVEESLVGFLSERIMPIRWRMGVVCKLFILATHTQYNSTASSSYKADGRNFYQQYGKGSAGGKIQNSKFYFILQKYVQTILKVLLLAKPNNC